MVEGDRVVGYQTLLTVNHGGQNHCFNVSIKKEGDHPSVNSTPDKIGKIRYQVEVPEIQWSAIAASMHNAFEMAQTAIRRHLTK